MQSLMHQNIRSRDSTPATLVCDAGPRPATAKSWQIWQFHWKDFELGVLALCQSVERLLAARRWHIGRNGREIITGTRLKVIRPAGAHPAKNTVLQWGIAIDAIDLKVDGSHVATIDQLPDVPSQVTRNITNLGGLRSRAYGHGIRIIFIL